MVLQLWDQRKQCNGAPIHYMSLDVRVQDWEGVPESAQWMAQPMPGDKLRKLSGAMLQHLGAAEEVDCAREPRTGGGGASPEWLRALRSTLIA